MPPQKRTSVHSTSEMSINRGTDKLIMVLPYNGILVIHSEKAMATHSSTLAWKIPGQRILVGCCLWGRIESDTTERLHFHFSLSCIREGNGKPLQCACLENPRDGGAWWAAVYGVSQSRTRLKCLSSSSSSHPLKEVNYLCTPHCRYNSM